MTNPLTLIPAQYRQRVYALLALFALGYSAWMAADGDWRKALLGVLLTLSHGTAASNVKVKGSVGPKE
jgi:membrane protein required for beta-lactamase induction